MNERDVNLEDELNIIDPDATIRVGGKHLSVVQVPVEERTVQVREFTFSQALRLESVAAPLIEAMGDAVHEQDRLDWQALMTAAAQHPDALMEMIEVSTGESREYLDGLSDRDGRMVAFSFLKVNWDFFIDRLVVKAATRVTREDLQAAVASQKSSPH